MRAVGPEPQPDTAADDQRGPEGEAESKEWGYGGIPRSAEGE